MIACILQTTTHNGDVGPHWPVFTSSRSTFEAQSVIGESVICICLHNVRFCSSIKITVLATETAPLKTCQPEGFERLCTGASLCSTLAGLRWCIDTLYTIQTGFERWCIDTLYTIQTGFERWCIDTLYTIQTGFERWCIDTLYTIQTGFERWCIDTLYTIQTGFDRWCIDTLYTIQTGFERWCIDTLYTIQTGKGGV